MLDSEGKLKETYIGKLILIPVFFCCESLFLFSEEVRNFIRNIENSAGNETVRLIKLYKILSAGSEEDLRDMMLTDETLAAFYNELETYGKSIYGLEKDICDKFA